MTGGLCSFSCSDAVDQPACDAASQVCAGDGVGTGSSGDGLDETGDGAMGETYDCSQWSPGLIGQPVAGGPFAVPQALVDALVLGSAEPLAECDGVRLRQGSSGGWVIARMGSGGLLGALGLRVGDELEAFDGVALDSLDALLGILGRFVDEDGSPRQFLPSDPTVALRVRRGEQELVRGLRVVPSAIETPAGGQ
jgi:hypothetical protein